MKEQPALRPTLDLLKIRYPLIHPEDAWNALVNRTTLRFASRPPRTAKRAEEILENVFLAVISDVPPQQWLNNTWQFIQERVQVSKVGNFWKRLASATTDLANRRRKPLFDEVDLFLLENWRELQFLNPDNSRGLHAWPSSNVIRLLNRKNIPGRSNDMKWYHKRTRLWRRAPNSPGSLLKFSAT